MLLLLHYAYAINISHLVNLLMEKMGKYLRDYEYATEHTEYPAIQAHLTRFRCIYNFFISVFLFFFFFFSCFFVPFFVVVALATLFRYRFIYEICICVIRWYIIVHGTCSVAVSFVHHFPSEFIHYYDLIILICIDNDNAFDDGLCLLVWMKKCRSER